MPGAVTERVPTSNRRVWKGPTFPKERGEVCSYARHRNTTGLQLFLQHISAREQIR